MAFRFSIISSAEQTLDDWYCVALSNPSKPTFFCTTNVKHRVLMWNEDEWWMEAEQLDVGLPVGTLVYGEVCAEFSDVEGVTVCPRRTNVLHVIDVICLQFKNLLHYSIVERRDILMKYYYKPRLTGRLYLRPLIPPCKLIGFVRVVRAPYGWKRVVGNDRKKALMFKADLVWYLAGGIGFLNMDRFGAIVDRPQLWDWSSQTRDILNKNRDEPTHFRWFENRLCFCIDH